MTQIVILRNDNPTSLCLPNIERDYEISILGCALKSGKVLIPV